LLKEVLHLFCVFPNDSSGIQEKANQPFEADQIGTVTALTLVSLRVVNIKV
jgi:hypothetical protein